MKNGNKESKEQMQDFPVVGELTPDTIEEMYKFISQPTIYTYHGKRVETLGIENILSKNCEEKRIYGCEEVTIGFVGKGRGNEIVDFMSMDSKGIIKCYEIKVTLQDLKSGAAKSWYGNYNYLVVGYNLMQQKDKWIETISKSIGIMYFSGSELHSFRKAVRNEIDTDTSMMLKESLLRSLYYKMKKYKDSSDLEKTKRLQKRISDAEIKYDDLSRRFDEFVNLRYRFVKAYIYNNGLCQTHSTKRTFENMVENEVRVAADNGMDISDLDW